MIWGILKVYTWILIHLTNLNTFSLLLPGHYTYEMSGPRKSKGRQKMKTPGHLSSAVRWYLDCWQVASREASFQRAWTVVSMACGWATERMRLSKASVYWDPNRRTLQVIQKVPVKFHSSRKSSTGHFTLPSKICETLTWIHIAFFCGVYFCSVIQSTPNSSRNILLHF